MAGELGSAFVDVTVSDKVTTVTLNRPEALNALNAQMHGELQNAIDAFAADARQLVCVITGAGDRAFCAGSDLKASAETGLRDRYPGNGYAGIVERFDLAKPIIAAVNGLALGGGLEIVLACDLVIAGDNARFGLPEPLVGAVAIAGGLHRLVRQIGLKPAMGMILTGRQVSAAEAARLGFVNEVVQPEELDAATSRWCEAIKRGAPLAVQASKQAAMAGLDRDIAAAFAHQEQCAAFRAWRESDDLREGLSAFSDKRPPIWKGQ